MLDWWAGPALMRVWKRVAERLERGGLQPRGRIRVDDLDRDERHAISGLLGRSVASSRCIVDLAVLDARLWARSGTGLVAVTEQVLGRRLTDRRALRQARGEKRAEPYAAAQDWLSLHPVLNEPWVDRWLAALRRDGLPSRDLEPTRLVLAALEVLHACLERQGQPMARTQLAASVLHDAHGLDDDRRLSQLVLRALAERDSQPSPSSASGRRNLWETVGVTADSVSTTCLVLGLAALGPPGLASRLRLASDDGAPVHLTWWDLRQGLVLEPGQDVLVCENPRVLEALAEQGRADVAVVCTSGRPALVAQEVINRLVETDARMRYHGDFDWPGIAMANQLLSSAGATPWLMSAEDYRAAPATLVLAGPSVEPLWDDELGAAMRDRGLVVHEEAVLMSLLAAL